jgi:hypothetical protein
MGVLVVTALAVGFVVGRYYQAAVATWTDHAAQRVKEQKLRRARWAAWRALAWPVVGVVGVLVVLAAGR